MNGISVDINHLKKGEVKYVSHSANPNFFSDLSVLTYFPYSLGTSMYVDQHQLPSILQRDR